MGAGPVRDFGSAVEVLFLVEVWIREDCGSGNGFVSGFREVGNSLARKGVGSAAKRFIADGSVEMQVRLVKGMNLEISKNG